MEVLNKEHITRGEAEVITLDLFDYKQVCIGSQGSKQVLLHMYLPEHKITPDIEANAEFIKDCFNVLNESGKTARELLERVKELEDGIGRISALGGDSASIQANFLAETAKQLLNK